MSLERRFFLSSFTNFFCLTGTWCKAARKGLNTDCTWRPLLVHVRATPSYPKGTCCAYAHPFGCTHLRSPKGTPRAQKSVPEGARFVRNEGECTCCNTKGGVNQRFATFSLFEPSPRRRRGEGLQHQRWSKLSVYTKHQR